MIRRRLSGSKAVVDQLPRHQEEGGVSDKHDDDDDGHGAEMEKGGDTGDIFLLFFLAGANFWAILGHFWTNLRKVQIFWWPRWGRGTRF